MFQRCPPTSLRRSLHSRLAEALPHNGVATTLVTRRDDAERWRRRSPDARIASIVPDLRPLRLAFEAVLLGASGVARASDVWHAPQLHHAAATLDADRRNDSRF